MATESQIIASEILKQLGGNRFLVMTGSKNLAATGKGLSMKLTRNNAKATHLTITLDADDTYTLTFVKVTVKEFTTVKETKGVYCDMLQNIFTSVTGLYTHL